MSLRNRRLKRNLSQRALADLSGLSTGYISKLENGKGNPTNTAYIKLKKVFPTIKFDELTAGSES